MSRNIKELANMSKDIKLLYVEDARETTLKLLKNFFTNIITTAVDGEDELNNIFDPYFSTKNKINNRNKNED